MEVLDMDHMRGIVVGVDGSAGAAAALQWALREGALRKLGVTAVLAWGYLDQRHAPGTATVFDPHYVEADAQGVLDAAVATAVGIDAAKHVCRRTVCDLPDAALVDCSRDADLLVVGARGLEGFRSLLVGSVSEHCAHHAHCPVAVIHPPRDDGRLPDLARRPATDTTERIVVGVDDSKAADVALAWALDEAHRRNALMDVVHAWQLPPVGPSALTEAAMIGLEDDARHLLDSAVAAHDTDDLPGVRRLLFNGGPAASILETAQGADLVVVGTRGRSVFRALLLGSVSRQVLHHAPCPVVVVPPETNVEDDVDATPSIQRKDLVP
jgi:nucleotide-binding universal stress UspA family protein